MIEIKITLEEIKAEETKKKEIKKVIKRRKIKTGIKLFKMMTEKTTFTIRTQLSLAGRTRAWIYCQALKVNGQEEKGIEYLDSPVQESGRLACH